MNGLDYEVPLGITIVEAAQEAGIRIPTLCHLDLYDLKMVNQTASCRVCMVESPGRDTLVPACVTKVHEGMEIRTDSLKAITARRMAVELLL